MFSTLLNRAGRTALTAVTALALTLWAAPAQAQQGAVAGQVLDGSNLEPVVGAQVFLPGTELGALTNEEGRYRITGVPAGQREIRVRLLGYRSASQNVTIRAGETTTTNFQLSVSAVALEEVVVTATGERRSREVGNAISTVNAAQEVEQTNPQNLTNLLKGRSTGVSVQRSSGSVGTGDLFKVRGNSTLGLSSTPIIIVDGARVDNDNASGPGVGGQNASRLNDLNPEDIESIEVIKGPSAAALYGAGAAAGVIRITTKAGSASGDTRYTIRSNVGVNRESLINWPSGYVNPQGLFGAEAVDPGGFIFGIPGLLGPPVAVTDTLYEMNLMEPNVRPVGLDGYANPFRDGAIQTYGGSVRGGSEFVTYYVSGEFNAEDGNLPNNQFNKFNVRGNFNLSPSDEIDISVSNGFTSNALGLPDNDNNGFGYIGVGMLGFPWQTPFSRSNFVDGSQVETCPLNYEIARVGARSAAGADGIAALLGGVPLLDLLGPCAAPGFGGRTFDDVATLQNNQHIERYTGSATGTYRPWDFLTNRVTIGYDAVANDVPQLVPVDPDLPFGTSSEGFKFSFQETKQNLTLEATSTLNLDLTEDLNSQFTAGGQWFRQINQGTSGTGQTLPSGCTTISCAVTTTGAETFVEEKTAGFFFQEQLGWKDRIFITPSVRFDDNSAFGANLGLQTLPSVNGSYIMSDEDWFPQAFDQFRVRAAWGKSTLQPGPFDAFNLLDPTRVTFQGASFSGVTVTDPGNPDLRPETGEEWEAGMDFSVLDGRLSLEATYYDQTTSDAIVFQPLKPSFGFPGSQPTNVGEIVSRGFEFGLDAIAVDIPDLTWDWRVNLSTNDGEVTELTEPIIFGLGGSSQRHTEGFPFASYFTERVTASGGSVNVGTDAVFHGHPTPEYEGSVSTTISLFDRITLYGLVDFAGGHQQFNSTQEFACGFLGGGDGGGICGAMFERNASGDFTDEALVKQTASAIVSESPWIEDADYAKLRTVSLRFTLPERWLQPIQASGASLTLVGENLANFTGYTGLDPELNFGGSSAQATRADFLTLPPGQRYLAEFSLTF
jgi:TonB-linked SusC/RagA family outer membrane protein